MGNICCCLNKNSEINNNDLLNNTIYCHYCNRTMLFNEYYKHFNTCKHNFNYRKFGDI